MNKGDDFVERLLAKPGNLHRDIDAFSIHSTNGSENDQINHSLGISTMV
jgi:hypothetical protein